MPELTLIKRVTTAAANLVVEAVLGVVLAIAIFLAYVATIQTITFVYQGY